MERAEERIYLIAHGRNRAEIEAYLYGGNEILLEYEAADRINPYYAIIQCYDEDGGFGARNQLMRLASGSLAGGQPQTLAEAEHDVVALFGATPKLEEIGRPGNLSRPSALSEDSLEH
jgi:hypothetical protein